MKVGNNKIFSYKLFFAAIAIANILLALSSSLISCRLATKNDEVTIEECLGVENLKSHVQALTSTEMNGRATGTTGQRQAAAYLQNQFKKIGLASPQGLKNFEQSYPLYKDSLQSVALSIGNSKAVNGVDVCVSLRNTVSATVQSSSIVFAGYGIEDKNYNDFTFINVKDEIVVICLGEPRLEGKFLVNGADTASDWTSKGIEKKLSLLALKGAKAVLIINPGQPSFSKEFITENTISELYYNTGTEKKLPFLLLSRQYAEKSFPWNVAGIYRKANMQETFEKSFMQEANIAVALSINKQITTVNASNIIGVVEGSSRKDECIIVMAHYDHLGNKNGKIYFGADDNASGTVALLSLAKVFANVEKPLRTIVFVAVSGEENGLWGSNYYAKNPVILLSKTSVVINMDMIGRVDSERKLPDSLDYVYVVGQNKISSGLKGIVDSAKIKSGIIVDDKYDFPGDKTRIYYRSDHYSLAKLGVPALFFYDGMQHADYHKPTDTADKINWQLFNKRLLFIYQVLKNSDAIEFLKRDILLN